MGLRLCLIMPASSRTRTNNFGAKTTTTTTTTTTKTTTMGDWQRILFERRLLTWSSLLSFAGLGLWLAALASPHWLVAVPRPTLVENSTTVLPSPLLSPPEKGEAGRGLIWSHSGLYSLHSLVEDEDGLWWETEMWTVPRVPALHS